MFRTMFYLTLSACAVLVLANGASAQIIIPGLPFPKMEGIPQELQKQLEEAFQRAALQRQPGRVNDGTIRWGGMKLGKVDATLQTQLGLPENEGLIVASVDANSAADKAGIKASDVLVKINGKAVPNDLNGFSKLVKDEKVNEAADLGIVRKGKEETIKAAKLPAVVQGGAGGAGRPGQPGGLGGLLIPPIRVNPRGAVNPLGNIEKLHLEMTVNGAKIVRDQKEDQFSGEYAKDDLKITISGKISKQRVATVSEITIQEGKETKRYTKLNDVPAQYLAIVRQLGPTVGNAQIVPTLPNLQGLQLFPGLPIIPGLDD